MLRFITHKLINVVNKSNILTLTNSYYSLGKNFISIPRNNLKKGKKTPSFQIDLNLFSFQLSPHNQATFVIDFLYKKTSSHRCRFQKARTIYKQTTILYFQFRFNFWFRHFISNTLTSFFLNVICANSFAGDNRGIRT